MRAAVAELSPPCSVASPNFRDLATVVPLLALKRAKAERYVFEDPNTALLKLRKFGGVLAHQEAGSTGSLVSRDEPQIDLLRRYKDARVVDYAVADLFHILGKAGNAAVHDHRGTQKDALNCLRVAWKLAAWSRQAFRDPDFTRGAFVPTPDPLRAEHALKVKLAQLRGTLADHQPTVDRIQATGQEQIALDAPRSGQGQGCIRERGGPLPEFRTVGPDNDRATSTLDVRRLDSFGHRAEHKLEKDEESHAPQSPAPVGRLDCAVPGFGAVKVVMDIDAEDGP